MIDRRKLDAIRQMQADWVTDMQRVDVDDHETIAALTVISGALIGLIPDLLDEIARLSQTTVVKLDRHGGRA